MQRERGRESEAEREAERETICFMAVPTSPLPPPPPPPSIYSGIETKAKKKYENAETLCLFWLQTNAEKKNKTSA